MTAPEMPPFVRRLIGLRIKQLTGSTSSPDAFAQPAGDPGLLGPDAVSWRVHAHFVGMMVGGLSSLMLQAARTGGGVGPLQFQKQPQRQIGKNRIFCGRYHLRRKSRCTVSD